MILSSDLPFKEIQESFSSPKVSRMVRFALICFRQVQEMRPARF